MINGIDNLAHLSVDRGNGLFVRSAVGAAAVPRAVHLIELGEDQVRSLVGDVAGDGVSGRSIGGRSGSYVESLGLLRVQFAKSLLGSPSLANKPG